MNTDKRLKQIIMSMFLDNTDDFNLDSHIEKINGLFKPEWVSVSEEKPKEEVNFLSFSPVYGYQVSMYSNNPFNSTLLTTFDDLQITHWLPIPVAPNDKEKA